MTMRAPVLVFSRHYAPSPAVGGKRFSFLCRELLARGFDVRVVCAELDDSEAPDASLPAAGWVQRCAPLVRLPLRRPMPLARVVNRLARSALAPLDYDVGWIAPALRAARRAVRSGERGVVIATVPPFSSALAAALFARRARWPLILDYRDPWSGYHRPARLRGPVSRRLARSLERYCLGLSTVRVFNTVEMKAGFEQHFPELAAARNFVIPNGIDPPHAGQAAHRAEHADLVHAGAIYGDRSLRPVLRALRRLAVRRPELAAARLIVYGEVTAPEREAIARDGLGDLIEVRERSSREQLWQALRSAAVLVAVSGDQMRYSVPYKLYDYLGAGPPILGLASRGTALERFFAEQRVGEFAEPTDAAAVEAALERLLGGTAPEVDPRAVEAHLWSRLALDYERVIEIARGARPPRTV